MAGRQISELFQGMQSDSQRLRIRQIRSGSGVPETFGVFSQPRRLHGRHGRYEPHECPNLFPSLIMSFVTPVMSFVICCIRVIRAIRGREYPVTPHPPPKR